ncbi:hypothetical protein OG528_31930 [Streptomyces platensis]|uniref:hypothetical protein n=1 Tax=Streptomyces platensis TaxID=58346 RepID=UPI0030E2B889
MSLVSQIRTVDITANEPLLSYELTTSPDPLKASPEDPQTPEVTGELVIVGSRQNRTPADVEWIKVNIPAGTMSPDLSTDLTKATARISLSNWTVRLDTATEEFVFTPTASHTPIGPDTGFTIQISQIPINRTVGSSPITVTESSRTGSSAFRESSTEFNVGKFPPDFYMRNFLCNPLVIDNGGEATLTWERSPNATYELLYGETNLNVTNVTTRTITNIKSDTTFYLRGTAGDTSNPVERILYAQVTVHKPDLNIGNLTVNGEASFNNTVRVSSDVTVENALTVKGLLTADGPTDLITHGQLQSWEYGASTPNFFTYTAPTSGVFLVFLGNTSSDRGTHLTIRREAPDGTILETENVTSAPSSSTGNIRQCVTVPMAKDHRISFENAGQFQNTVLVLWVPFGKSGSEAVQV